MGRLFGTDGARGVANSELTCELAMKIGRAAAMVLTEATRHRPTIVIGKDTRISSDMLEAALIAGLCSVGADVQLLGFVPTPAVAYLVRQYKADAGVMISASHNPVEYNGIKIFSGEGYKLSDALEDEIEAIVLDGAREPDVKTGAEIGRVTHAAHAVRDYMQYLAGTISGDLSGLKIAVDCANGSASTTAPVLFASLSAECEILYANPDGTNINADCGSTHIGSLSRFVKENKCDIGVAFDGDADRCLAVDENGELIDGDKMIAIFARYLKENGRLRSDTAVVTVMSNLGFFRCAEKNGIRVATTRVGDRYVLEEMRKGGYVVGGEQSGHIIFLEYATTGDGQLSALQLLHILKDSGKKASALASLMEYYPQVMVNVKVGQDGREKLGTNEKVCRAVDEAKAALGGEGRVLVRCSGTEPLIRVMVEGREKARIEALAERIAGAVRAELA